MSKYNFYFDPFGEDIEVDFSVNLAFDFESVSFLLFDGDQITAEEGPKFSTPVGKPDFRFMSGEAIGTSIRCQFDCYGAPVLIGQILKVKVFIKQGNSKRVYKLSPVTVKGHDGVAFIDKWVWIRFRERVLRS